MTSTLQNTNRANILVVDDTPQNLRLLAEILSNQGYQVRPVPNGKLALSAAQKMPPDIVLLDIMMPDMDGYEVCQRLKDSEVTKDIPVIFISAINDVMDKVKAFAVGGVDFITKPFQVEEVLARIETHLKICSLQQSLQEKNQDLATAIYQLQATQEHLIQSEKMAALGQLIAGIAHEINTPLGIIGSSIDNISNFWDENLEKMPQFFQQLSEESQACFLALLHRSTNHETLFTSREKRKIKQQLRNELMAGGIENAEEIADSLVDMEIYDRIEELLPFFKLPDWEVVFNTAYQFASFKKSISLIQRATAKSGKVVFALKSYAHFDSKQEKVQANLHDGIEMVLTLYQNQLKHGIEVVKNYGDLPKIMCYPDDLNQVWTNLIHNALQAMDYKGILTIETKQQETNLVLKFTDDGKGIPPEVIPKIFHPFFTTKSAGEGSGLGLDIVRKIVDKHEGTIAVESVPGQTSFTVSLPIY
ncbi:MAG: response regulator [Microcoleus sp. PH2017_01_SCD_O_A]|jgi:two-component system, NtrC family, sensor kinase|uniref:hybrid sensor histidine kinase/response regulator n=1 Tax=unclassified Microcoleus TaxID=2642155 RepID=UPI001D3A5C79|nr:MULTISPECIES: response regulator [unclassified Microcoleus]MCC3419031.1 response regulator [Microcoleus sp. PH2017_07_MST_O_A]MCC3428637.1 response regulator [Microcoleus sp. PH2017_04_SCI_O_A]MCC3441135.1 response regulator [Microcoleus sp. PH2017_03_ELD_O_A]MCC3503003.1 response regulator [Microcoleus sp. PH2017_19_SFW_U_A]TAE10838.1 MAG: hybrid sensor histidine kinase/response regulator [Oscillatoriales cyanobacterium]